MDKATVERYMSERLVTMSIKSTVQDIARVMDKNNVSSVLITAADDESGKKEIVGILTERDVVRVVSRDLPPDRIIALSPPLVYVDADAPLEQASEAMLRNHVRHLLVRDPDSREIVGILTSTDLVRYLRSLHATRDFTSVLEAASVEASNY
jgi:CBS domain-containing protein